MDPRPVHVTAYGTKVPLGVVEGSTAGSCATPRPSFNFTPTSSSWLNRAERWFAELTRKRLQRSAHKTVKALTADLDIWIGHWNEDPKPFVWQPQELYVTNL